MKAKQVPVRGGESRHNRPQTPGLWSGQPVCSRLELHSKLAICDVVTCKDKNGAIPKKAHQQGFNKVCCVAQSQENVGTIQAASERLHFGQKNNMMSFLTWKTNLR